MPILPNDIEVITLFVDDVARNKAFYEKLFDTEIVYEDDVSAVLKFSGMLINLLESSRGPELVEPIAIATSAARPRFVLTVKLDDVDAACSILADQGVALINGPIDRPWGRRTAAFADPSGHIWEIAQELK